jgi:hypothetical protein
MAETVVDAVGGQVVVGAIADVVGVVGGRVVVEDGIEDAAGRVGEDTRAFCHG